MEWIHACMHVCPMLLYSVAFPDSHLASICGLLRSRLYPLLSWRGRIECIDPIISTGSIMRLSIWHMGASICSCPMIDRDLDMVATMPPWRAEAGSVSQPCSEICFSSYRRSLCFMTEALQSRSVQWTESTRRKRGEEENNVEMLWGASRCLPRRRCSVTGDYVWGDH
jgi:hypothetical protein